jgi:hypothetical protein
METYIQVPPIPYGVMNFMAALEICFQIADQKKGRALNFKGLSQNGGRTNFSEYLRASLFNDDIPIKPTFG